MDLNDKQKKIMWVLISVVVVLIIVWNGGPTITVMNRTLVELCEVNFAASPEEDGWGRDWLLGSLRKGHSRDINLSLFWVLSSKDTGEGFSGRAIDIATRMPVQPV